MDREAEIEAVSNREGPPDAAGEGAQAGQRHHRERGLLLIALFKLGKAIFFFLVGLGALHLIHRNLGDLTMHIASWLHFDPEGKFVDMLEDRADLVSGHQLRQVGGLSILYSAVALTEGYGLIREKVWAEYLTLTLTLCALPWEIFELVRRANWSRWSLLVTNLLVVVYLLWLLRRNGKAAWLRL
jgi:uncharacterized membrane protein (DUF2068 family)